MKKILLLVIVLLLFVSYFLTRPKLIPSKSQEITPPIFPILLIIPSINVNAQIQSLGVNLRGEMDVPDNILDVGWFNLGSHPGEIGSAVIAGHLNGPQGKVGVFANLSQVKIGDQVIIQNSDQKRTLFKVSSLKIYPSGYAPEVFTRNDGAYLNLITCDGLWDQSQDSYTTRLVIFTTLISQL